MAPIAAGNSKARQEAVACLANRARAVFVSVADTRGSLGFSRPFWRELTLMGSFVMRIYMYWALGRLMIVEQVLLERTITHRLPIEQAAEAFSLFAEGKTGTVVSEFSREKGRGR